jgi:hypothetical protein
MGRGAVAKLRRRGRIRAHELLALPYCLVDRLHETSAIFAADSRVTEPSLESW